MNARDIDQQRLILLEEGHCLRDQALAYCAGVRPDSPLGLGATSLATVMQMVANGYGVTLVPQIAVDVEVRDERVKLLRFAKPEPGRTIGLGLAAHLAAQGGLCRARADRHRSARGRRRQGATRGSSRKGSLAMRDRSITMSGASSGSAADTEIVLAARRMQWLKLATGLIALGIIAGILVTWRWG